MRPPPHPRAPSQLATPRAANRSGARFSQYAAPDRDQILESIARTVRERSRTRCAPRRGGGATLRRSALSPRRQRACRVNRQGSERFLRRSIGRSKRLAAVSRGSPRVSARATTQGMLAAKGAMKPWRDDAQGRHRGREFTPRSGRSPAFRDRPARDTPSSPLPSSSCPRMIPRASTPSSARTR
jgi:hypothetical protein